MNQTWAHWCQKHLFGSSLSWSDTIPSTWAMEGPVVPESCRETLLGNLILPEEFDSSFSSSWTHRCLLASFMTGSSEKEVSKVSDSEVLKQLWWFLYVLRKTSYIFYQGCSKWELQNIWIPILKRSSVESTDFSRGLVNHLLRSHLCGVVWKKALCFAHNMCLFAGNKMKFLQKKWGAVRTAWNLTSHTKYERPFHKRWLNRLLTVA